MELTQEQRLILTQRIADEFRGFVKEELQYQVESMKDADELSWDYYVTPGDESAVIRAVIDTIAVPVE